ncbi:T9SS type A sorting domain-containing protein [Hymenobacter sp. GOD-10R]|uniref:T9SS type A sorting domain-containing protein n=1 Tax=Hymenobacter sp. GOD-10R TaxID=3093922 RepID=UPI002D796B2A|nr:T9SS type A sorting domain-containing protein [Hymenobacter sp. GOD-10R]WRQ27276.1 T9SS type A sorting domain-containing protein [Hymenobacter sp. GOD-10R]
MRVTSFKTFLFFLFVLILTTGYLGAFAQGPARGADKPARKELRVYYEENILPTVRQQRQKLETQLSAEDKALLATYRTQLQANRQQGNALRQSLRTAPATSPGQARSSRPELTEAQRQQFQQQRTENHAIMQKVAQLAQKYSTNIKQLSTEIEPQREKWVADTKAIVAKYATPEQQERLAHFAGGRHGRGGAGLGHYFRPGVFLLIDPSVSETSATTATSLGSTVFPNPSTATTQLEYAVTKAGPVTVELLDSRGTTLRTLISQQSKEKGSHVLVTNVDDLPSGTYYYKITTRASTETKRFQKQ